MYWFIRTIIPSANFTKSQSKFKAPGNRNTNTCSRVTVRPLRRHCSILTMKGRRDTSSPSLLLHEVCFHHTKSSAGFAASHWINKHSLAPGWFYQLLPATARTGVCCVNARCARQKLEAHHQVWGGDGHTTGWDRDDTGATGRKWHLPWRCKDFVSLRLFFSIEQSTKSLTSKSCLKRASELHLINIKPNNILHANSDHITGRDEENKKRISINHGTKLTLRDLQKNQSCFNLQRSLKPWKVRFSFASRNSP